MLNWATCDKHNVSHKLVRCRIQDNKEFIHYIDSIQAGLPDSKPIIWAQVGVKMSGKGYNFLIDQDKAYIFEPGYFQFMQWINDEERAGFLHESAWKINDKKAVPTRLNKLFKLVERCLKHSL